MNPYIPQTEKEQKAMLKEIGVESPEDLFKHLPEESKLKEPLGLPEGVSELELERHVRALAVKNKVTEEDYVSFLGAGHYQHFIPAVVDEVAASPQFYTSYTPYQAEASQGMLQGIFEYQSLVSNLFSMEVSNASLYDGATAVTEAVLLAIRRTQKAKVLFSRAIHPEYRRVLETYTRFQPFSIQQIDYRDGITNLEQLEKNLDNQTAAVVVQHPNFFGYLEEVDRIRELTSSVDALFIVSVNPISLGLLAPPGEYGADIAVAEGQSLGNYLNYGGSCLGIFTTRKRFIRDLPGRLVGQTEDREGNRGYVLTLQTREQHIRRQKATSNICTNQALNALRAAIYLSTMGEEGLKEVARLCFYNSHYAQERITNISGFKSVFTSPFFKEFVVECPIPPEEINKRLLKKGIVGGFALQKVYPELKNCMSFCCTEMHGRTQIEQLVHSLEEIS